MFKFKVENRDLINLGFQLDKWGRVVAKWGRETLLKADAMSEERHR
jgi:hypothetical protein